MQTNRSVRRAVFSELASAALVLTMVAGCGGDDSDDTRPPATSSETSEVPALATTTTAGAPSTQGAPSTEGAPSPEASADMASMIESLSYLMQGLLTTPQIGGGWVDMGRVIIPPSTEQSLGPICPAGREQAESIGTALNAQVHTTFSRYDVTQATVPTGTDGTAVNPAFAGASVMETLLWNERESVDDAFATLAAATAACSGTEWTDPDSGEVTMTSFDAPTLGTDSFTSGYAPATPPATDPWLETQGITILMSDPSSPVSVVISVTMQVVHNDPSGQVTSMDTEELTRIAQAAVTRIMDGL